MLSATQEMVVFRDDLQNRMRKLCLLAPNGEPAFLSKSCCRAYAPALPACKLHGLLLVAVRQSPHCSALEGSDGPSGVKSKRLCIVQLQIHLLRVRFKAQPVLLPKACPA